MAATTSTDAQTRTRFDTLFDAHYAAVRAYVVRRSVGNMAGADDALSETFLVAWRRLDAVPPDALPWLLAVARRILANQRRADARRGALVERLGGLLPRAAAFDHPIDVSHGPVGTAIANLSPREREALLLVAWEELDPQRAAHVVGCSPATFRARLYRARRRLAAELGEPTQSTSAEEAR